MLLDPEPNPLLLIDEDLRQKRASLGAFNSAVAGVLS
jgi:hypothetical protein